MGVHTFSLRTDLLHVSWYGVKELVIRFIGHFFVFFKQKTAYEMRISDWSSDVCSSDLLLDGHAEDPGIRPRNEQQEAGGRVRRGRHEDVEDILVGHALHLARRVAGDEAQRPDAATRIQIGRAHV